MNRREYKRIETVLANRCVFTCVQKQRVVSAPNRVAHQRRNAPEKQVENGEPNVTTMLQGSNAMVTSFLCLTCFHLHAPFMDSDPPDQSYGRPGKARLL